LITSADILETFIEVLGINEPSVRIELELENRTGSLADAAKIIKDLGLYLVSAVTLPKTDRQTRATVFRVQPTDLKKLKEQLSAAGPPIVAVHE
jgi:acetoin utilization protein AcuB